MLFTSICIHLHLLHAWSIHKTSCEIAFSAERSEESRRVPCGSSISKLPDFSSSLRVVSLKEKELSVGTLNSSAPWTSFVLTRPLRVAQSWAFEIISLRCMQVYIMWVLVFVAVIYFLQSQVKYKLTYMCNHGTVSIRGQPKKSGYASHQGSRFVLQGS